MKRHAFIFLLITISRTALTAEVDDDALSPDLPAAYIKLVAPTTRPWHEADDSLKSVNAGLCLGVADRMIQIMGEGLIGKSPMIMWDREYCKVAVPNILEALCRSGNSQAITNILHQALVATNNHSREVTFFAYVKAAPVPMTVLAETIVKRIPVEQRTLWYGEARRRSFDPTSPWSRFIDHPSREALRFAHFLYTVKPLETDPECLRVIGNPVDPKRE